MVEYRFWNPKNQQKFSIKKCFILRCGYDHFIEEIGRGILKHVGFWGAHLVVTISQPQPGETLRTRNREPTWSGCSPHAIDRKSSWGAINATNRPARRWGDAASNGHGTQGSSMGWEYLHKIAIFGMKFMLDNAEGPCVSCSVFCVS